MSKDAGLEKMNHEVKAEKKYAQIVIEFAHSSKTFEEAKKIIEDMGVYIIEIKHQSPNKILFILDSMDMREIVLKLTENGFLNIKGINAINFK